MNDMELVAAAATKPQDVSRQICLYAIMQQLEFAQSQLEVFAPVLQKRKRRTPNELKAQIKINSVKKELQAQLSGALQQLVTKSAIPARRRRAPRCGSCSCRGLSTRKL